MKQFILAFAMSIGSLTALGQGFDKMWAKVEQLQEEGKPQSAYAATEKILKKALSEGQQGQALSARLRMAGLHQEWAPDSFFTDVTELETLRRNEPKAEARAIYASILAEVYERNRNRSQAFGLMMTSEDMKEWTTEQYDSAARANWQLSLADIPLLSQARSKDWLPFVREAAHSALFGHDLLHILWQRVRNQRQTVWNRADAGLTDWGKAVRDEYIRLGNRQATLLVELDLAEIRHQQGASGPVIMPKRIGNTDEERQVQDTALIAELTTLITKYADLPVCTEAYLRLLQTDAPEAQKVEWAREALKRYPRYERIGEVQNRLNNICQPTLVWEGNETYYPGKTYTWKLRTKNTDKLIAEVLRLPADFDDEELNRNKAPISTFFHRRGTIVQKIPHSIAKSFPYQEVEDSMEWTAPASGRYVILFTASTTEKEAKQRTVNNRFQLIRVTALTTMIYDNHGDIEVVVVDGESGQPVEGATVTREERDYRTDKITLADSQTSDAEGRTHFTVADKNHRTTFRVSKGDDRWGREQDIYINTRGSQESIVRNNVFLYTDRAIYRPGQTVEVSGLATSTRHWDAETLTNREYTLQLRDANGKEVGKQTVRTDEKGVFSASFPLPEEGLPGIYRVQTDRTSVTFRVEAYKRPTFEVKMDQAPALQWPQDSITLTGKAIGYNSVPVREGRVTGRYHFSYPYFWWYRHADSPEVPIDTIQTDETGVFRAQVPLATIPAEALRYGLYLHLDIEVLSATGETREGRISVPLCTTPLRLNVTMQEQQNRDQLRLPAFSLLTSTGKPATGSIRWQIVAHDAADDATPLAQGTFDVTSTTEEPDLTGLESALQALPSGDYDLRAQATSQQDTASAKVHFYLFAITDTRLPRHTESWLYCPRNTFDTGHPARIQLGSSFEDVALYFRIEGPKGVVRNELIRISDELLTLEIPYQPEYGDGVSVHFAFVKGGKSYVEQLELKHTMPDYTLKWEWTSFRDRTRPGEEETWTLRLKHPDGTPADANLMATIYDASLDQLVPHHWNIAISRFHDIPYILCHPSFAYVGKGFSHLDFPMKWREVKELGFDEFDEKWTNGLVFGFHSPSRARFTGLAGARKGPMLMKAASNNNLAMVNVAADGEEIMAESAVRSEPMMAANAAGLADAADFRVEEAGTTEASVSQTDVALRTNFNETATFMPRLHTDPQTGEVTLSFTLPESLTTWQMLGVAHTNDMHTATVQTQTIARKELMARLYLPRFLRMGDEGNLRAAVQNLTDQPMNGHAKLEVFDPETERLILSREVPFSTEAQGETVLSFNYTPTEDYPVVAVRFTATGSDATTVTSSTTKGRKRKSATAAGSASTFSDGEQQYLAILPAKEWITESIEIQADSTGTFTTDLSTLFNKDSKTATQRRLTVEYTTHPIWNVVQALPALRETDSEDVLSITSVLYANVLSAHIAASTPRLKTIIEIWKEEAAGANSTQAHSATGNAGNAGTDNALTSPLARNEALKQIILDETPWLREAENDNERRAQLIDLFNENLAERRIGTMLQKLNERQAPDGGFSWFPGMRSSELMTRIVAIEMTRLRALTNNFATLTADTKTKANELLQSAVTFVANENARRIKAMKEAEAKGATINTGTLMHLHYVYITQQAGVRLSNSQQADVRYLLDHLKGSVAGMSNDERAMAAIVLKSAKREREAQLYFDALVEHMTTTTKHGTFFDYAGGSFTPTDNKIIIHTAAMEAVRTMKPNDRKLYNGLRRWLLQQKRTQMWESSICTTNAIYALLNGAAAELKNTARDELTLNYNRKQVKVESDTKMAGIGYVHAVYTDGKAPQSVTVKRNSPTEAWGAVYAQYLTPTADASAQSNGLSVRYELSSTKPRLGDKLTTRYVITADRDYEYVCLRAQRPAAAEPGAQVSGYHYQGGLGYYMAVHDAHTDYFFDRLPKGTYVLEETAFIDRTGTYSTGLTSLRCLYAPEYGGHAKAEIVEISE